MDNESKTTFESWAIVEIMGHRKLAGRVTEESIAGTNLLRIDVPPVPEREGSYGQKLQERPAFTQYFGASAIFSLTPCNEETARQSADQFRDYPVELVQAISPRPSQRRMDFDDDRDEDYDDY